MTESGWPTQGGTNNKAVPSQENHAAAISSLKAAFGGGGTNLILYGMYNDLWKKDSATTYGYVSYLSLFFSFGIGEFVVFGGGRVLTCVFTAVLRSIGGSMGMLLHEKSSISIIIFRDRHFFFWDTQNYLRLFFI